MENISTYTLSRTFSAPSLSSTTGFAVNKVFKAGDIVKGYATTEASGIKLIVTVDNFLIPQSAIDMPVEALPTKAGSATAQSAGNINQGAAKAPLKLPKELQDKLNALTSTDITKNIVGAARSSMNGLLFGAGLGLLFAVFKAKPFLPSILIGAVSGGLLGYGLNKVKK